ncbi:MAG: 50S ribosomal protein L22 [Candidatus Zambryskibacteria bacterium RIFCSPHIGHO2_01_FULL_46_30]|uniref:Large ribosomal subunit protein uL22 n=1 Tax=Candidatus Zambryskibacteria bacterium RIFCSPHIGHO2_01_FULL_46_30 TaxID=1802739 RepID=A0A1G2T785_9BACT|nr:MAG: 50S ribosomal protein L22 [Candidatus Zambryskibacteria bacterium RIFCSPHIGHO2_01_FULL_46_30]OHB05401.1 MAG: 50S ribosomal protein L22 [Candidatus Zambryskibacteria bacterium RIFCSPLOWO2_01_FULL_47_33]
MNEAKAQLNNYRQSPRKVRLVADTVRGQRVEDALTTLSFVPKRAALPLQKLLASALANAKNLSLPTENLVVKEIRVDAGATLYRSQPRSYRGGDSTTRKRTSHISVVLAESQAKTKKLKAKS